MKRFLILAILVVMCVAFVAGCDSGPTTKSVQQVMTEQYNDVGSQTSVLQINQPAPIIDFSNTRQAVIERIERWNDPNKISYLYLISYGKVMAFYTIKGSVESKRSYLFPTVVPYSKTYNGTAGLVTVDNPDVDGTYGDNSDAIFFFTTDGVYGEWKGEYLWADQPLHLTTEPALVYVAQLE